MDAKGNTNFNIVEIDTTEEDTAFELPFDLINLHKIRIKNLNADYTDHNSGMFASINDMSALIKGELTIEDAWAKLTMESGNIVFNLNDSTPLAAKLQSFETKIEGEKSGADINGSIRFEMPEVFFKMDTIVYANALPVEIDLPFTFNIDHQKITLDDAELALQKIKIFLNGTVQPSASFSDIGIDMAFHTNTWEIPEVIEIIPETYKSMLKDITATGNLELKGNAKAPIMIPLCLLLPPMYFLLTVNLRIKNLPSPLKILAPMYWPISI